MESIGESSCKGQEDGDGSSSERPLKKARYAWQVKGKHHLRNDLQETSKSSTSPTKPQDSENVPQETQNCITIDSDIENYSTSPNCPKESVVSENLLKTPKCNVTLDKYICPRYISSNDRMERYSNKYIDSPQSEDQCIAQWQIKQMVTSCLDNTINRALDISGQIPQNSDENPRFFAHDILEFVNHFPGDNTIENQGILMAISAHGLQNTTTSRTSSETQHEVETNVATSEIPPVPNLSTHDNQQNSTDEEKTPDNSDTLWPCDNSNDDDYFSEALPYPFFEDNTHQNIDNNESDHYDFMNAAVLFAIKSKGLTASGTDYG